MRELIHMWRHTRLVVLAAVSPALFATVLIPFKILPLIPGTTELRPANALPIVFSFLFGPAGAWGSAMGNLIGDFFGTLGPGTLFGFVGNLLYGYLPYRLWRAWSGGTPVPSWSLGWWLRFVATVAVSSAGCAVVIGWGLHLLGFVPFPWLSTIIFFNNLGFSLVLGPPLLRALHPRIARRGLLFTDLLEPGEMSAGRAPRLGSVLVTVGAGGGLLAGDYLFWTAAAGVPSFGDPVSLGVLPAVALVLVGTALL